MKRESKEGETFTGDFDGDFAFLAWLCALIGAFCAAIFAGARVGLEGSLLFPLLCVAILWAAAFSPFLVPHEWRSNERGRVAIGLISLTVLAGPLLSYWVPPSVFAIYPVLALVGTVLAWRRFRPSSFQIIALVMLPPLAACYLVTTMQSLQHGVNLFGPEFAKLGWFTTSAYWHATMAYLVQIHGAITLGLDGLDFQQRYHPGSHIWFGGLATAAGSTPLFAYPLGYMVIVLPGLLLAGGNFIIGASRTVVAWTRVLGLMALVLLFERISFPSFYHSESFGVSLVALMLSLPLLFVLRARGDQEGLGAYLPWLVAVALAIPLILIKVSTGIVWAALVSYWALRVWGFRQPALAIALLLAIALPLPLSISVLEWGRLLDIFIGASGPTSSAVPIQLGRFFREEPIWTFSTLLPAGLLLLTQFERGDKVDLVGKCAAAVARPYVEITLVMAGIGLVATALFLGGFDSRYFLAPALWFGLLCLVALIEATSLVRLSQVVGKARPAFSAGLVGACVLLLVLAVALKIEFNVNSMFGTARTMIAALKPNDPLGRAFDRDFSRAWGRNLFDSRLFDTEFAEALANSPGGRLEHVADALVGKNRHGVAVFVTLEQHAAWEEKFELFPLPGPFSPPLPRNCAEPFFVQALTGIPLLQGVPPFWRRCSEKNFRLGHDLVWQRLMTTELDDPSICTIARKKKFKQVLILGNVYIPERNRLLVCP